MSVRRVAVSRVLVAAAVGVCGAAGWWGWQPICSPVPQPVPAKAPLDPERPCPVREADQCQCRNSPVYTRSGVPALAETDLVVGGPGLALGLTRRYVASSQYAGMVGYGWVTAFEERVGRETDGAGCRAVVLLGSGTTTAFPEVTACGSPARQYGANEDGNPWTLEYGAPEAGKWTLYREDGSVEVFDAEGRLERVEDARGEALVLLYAGGRLSSVTDPKRPWRSLGFEWTANGFVGRVYTGSGPLVRDAQYGQDGYGDLVSVRGPDGWKRMKAYQTSSDVAKLCTVPHLVRRSWVEAPGGEAFPDSEAAGYDAAFRLASSSRGGRAVSWSYPPVPAGYPVLETVTQEAWTGADGSAQAKRLHMDPSGRITRVERYEGGALRSAVSRTYDRPEAEGGLAVRADYEQDEAGVWTRTARDAASGRTVSVTRDFCQGADAGAPGYCGTPGAHLNLVWSYRYDGAAPGHPLSEVAGPAGYAHAKMDYYPTTGVQANGDEGVAGKLWHLKRANDDASEDVLATYTYVSGAGSPAFGQVKAVSAQGGETAYGYGAGTGALSGVTLPKNGGGTAPAVGYAVDALYQVAEVTDQAGSVTKLLYDGAGRTSEVQPPDPATGGASAAFRTQFAYGGVEPAATFSADTDSDGAPDPLVRSSVTDANGRATERFSDAEGRVWRVRDASGNVTRYDYYPGGLLKSITDANGNATAYAYDGSDRLKTVTDPYGNATGYTYYPDGKLQSRTDGKGQTVTYGYDNAGRLTSKTYGASGAVTFTYAGDRVATVADTYHPQIGSRSQAYTYGYDVRHRLTSVASPTGTVTYGYEADDRDRIASVTDGAKAWGYAYYEDGSLQTITAPEGTYTYAYNAVGQAQSVGYPNGSSAAYAYDLQHRLTQVRNASAAGLISQYDYAYDQGAGPDAKPMRGMISAVTERFRHTDQALYGPYTTAYGYDALYELTSAAYPAFDGALGVPWSGQAHEWTYDAIGNRTGYTKRDKATQAVLDLATYTYNRTNKGPQLAGITHTDGEPGLGFTYDADGNTLTQTSGAAAPVVTTYGWDMDDRMTGLETSDAGLSAAYAYAYNGDRLEATRRSGRSPGPTATWRYLYDREDILRADQGEPWPLYLTQGPGVDDVLAETLASPAYAYKDMLSSVVQVADGKGAPAEAHHYDAWGDAAPWANLAVSNNPYGYTGREWENQQNYYYRARIYRPVAERFMQVDPLHSKGDENPYIYVLNRPIEAIDPTGLDTVGCDLPLRPLHGLFSRCHLQCCALHDKCYDDFKCSSNSWLNPGGEWNPEPCRHCNAAVVQCFGFCNKWPGMDLGVPTYYCAREHKFIEVPGPYGDLRQARIHCEQDHREEWPPCRPIPPAPPPPPSPHWPGPY